jgi:aminoglycoside phosphotransferase (APT) family kinase protein
MPVNPGHTDQPADPRPGEAPDAAKLAAFLEGRLADFSGPLEIRQYPGGYSNHTFLLTWKNGSCILRKPPPGADIRSAHDMSREFRVLTALRPHYACMPMPLLFSDDLTVMGTRFFLMERVSGTILRGSMPGGMHPGPTLMRGISEAAVDGLARLHRIDIAGGGLEVLGKPEGYVQRQVEGWIGRYEKAETDDIPDMRLTAEWMRAHLPPETEPAMIHNDYKYDNLVLDPADMTRILAVLDWEMATVGDPLMDLGTTLAYWCEANDSPSLRPFNLTLLPGNLSRAEVVERYAAERGMAVPDMLFYYVFGSYKIGVIVQQIYARYRKGIAKDPRFAGLIHVLKACAENARRAISVGRISDLY